MAASRPSAPPATVGVAGPLSGLRVVELQGRGPGPFGTMVLADLGADVVSIARVADVDADDGTATERLFAGRRRIDLVTRGKRSVAIDLKRAEGLAVARRLVDGADVLVEGNRPGVAERLGLGPDDCTARNPRLVYARITGWGQDGPQADRPGHDINYVALAGALEHLRRPGQPPMPPLNLLGDYGGGGMLLVVGVLAALVERGVSGRGQVVDAAMVDGVALLTTLFFGLRAEGLWDDEPMSNVLDLGAPHYNVYETADGRYASIGAGEPQFYAELLRRMGLDAAMADEQTDPATWPANRERLAAAFRTRTLAEWCELLEGADTCFAPVLTMEEATRHPHHAARRTFVEVDGVVQPAAAPRFGRTPAAVPGPPVRAGRDTVAVLLEAGYAPAEVDALRQAGVVAAAGREAR
jgi:alpha-methylacyl-CoA racemase